MSIYAKLYFQLLAYQKKKAKKGKKKSTECEESSNNSRSEPTSFNDLSATVHVQSESNVSPIPWDDESSATSVEISSSSMTLPLEQVCIEVHSEWHPVLLDQIAMKG